MAIVVTGELRIHTKAGKIETDMRDKTRRLVAMVEGETARVGERASENEKEAARLRKQAEDEALARAKLQTDLLKQGPRAALLQDPERKERLRKRLLPFAGQKFTVNRCVSFSKNTESTGAASRLLLFLQNEAKWTNTTPNSFADQPHCAGLGILVGLKAGASQATRDSGIALTKALAKIPFTTVNFDDTGKLTPNDPSVHMPFDTQTVVITVFEHP